jgi:hypothetical protein
MSPSIGLNFGPDGQLPARHVLTVKLLLCLSLTLLLDCLLWNRRRYGRQDSGSSENMPGPWHQTSRLD